MEEKEQRKLRLTIEKQFIYIYNEELERTLRYNLKEKQLQRKDRGSELWLKTENQYTFFRGYSADDLECLETERFKELIKVVKILNPNCESLSTFISRMGEALICENYIREGVKFECYATHNYSRYYSKHLPTVPIGYYPRDAINFFKKIDVVLDSNIEQAFKDDMELMKKVVGQLDSTDLPNDDKGEFLKVFCRHSDTKNLVRRHNYEVKALAKYLMGYIKTFEGIDIYEASRLLNDYYEMASTIGREVKRYPKYLHSMHDIINANYKAYRQEYDEKKFTNLIKKELEFEEGKYSVIVPKTPKEIIMEGTDLNHCVGSYVERILNESTYIMFLRLKEEKERSLITLELKNQKIIQAKGSYNRPIDENEKKFLDKYCKKLNIELAI